MTLSNEPSPKPRHSAIGTILLTGFVAGSLDILAAMIVYVYIRNLTTPMHLLQGIAKGVFGNAAFEGGTGMALAGLAVHFSIAFIFTIFYFLIFPLVPFLKAKRVVSGLLYGIFIWCVMNLAVLPLLDISPIPSKLKGIVQGALILMFCVGLPIALIIGARYSGRANQQEVN